MSDITRQATIAQATPLTTANHGGAFDPHPQYIKKTLKNTAQILDTSCYVEIGRYQVTSQNNKSVNVVNVLRGNVDTNVCYASLIFDVRQLTAMSNYPTINLLYLNGNKLTPDKFSAVCTKQGDGSYLCILYVLNDTAYESYTVNSLTTYGTPLDCTKSSPYLTTLTGDVIVNATLSSTFTPKTSYYQTVTATSSSQTQYSLIATMTLTAQYQYVESIIKFSLPNVSTGVKVSNLLFHAYQSAGMGSAPSVNLKILGGSSSSTDITANNFIAVVTQNTSGQSVINLYVTQIPAYAYYKYKLTDVDGNGTIQLYNKQAFISALPSGTQTIGSNQ